MAAMEIPLALPTYGPRSNVRWCYLLLDNLQEFATMAWYLVADGKLVEDVFSRALEALETASFNDSVPFSAYNHAREMVITQSIEVLAECREPEQSQFLNYDATTELPDLPHLAFMLRFVIKSSEIQVAKYLDVSPSRVRELIRDEIDYLNVCGPVSVLAGFSETEAS